MMVRRLIWWMDGHHYATVVIQDAPFIILLQILWDRPKDIFVSYIAYSVVVYVRSMVGDDMCAVTM